MNSPNRREVDGSKVSRTSVFIFVDLFWPFLAISSIGCDFT